MTDLQNFALIAGCMALAWFTEAALTLAFP